MPRAIFSIAINLFHAEAMVGQLMLEGFSIHAISLLLSHKDGTKDFVHELNTNTPEGITTRGGVGCILGGALGGLGGVGALDIPGTGSFMAVGPIMAALSGGAFDEGASGLAGTLIGLGIPKFDAERYEEKIKGGHILVCIRAEDSRESQRATEIFERFDAEDISTSRTVSMPEALARYR